MSAIYFLDMTVDAQFHTVVSAILKRGSEEGCIYFLNAVPATIEQVAYALTNPTPEDIDDGGPTVNVVYCDTMFIMWIQPEANVTRIGIDCCIGSWKNEFRGTCDSELYLDFARYARLILKLCDPFPVVSIDCGDI